MTVNLNPRRALEYTVQPQEDGNPRLPAGAQESWIYPEGGDVFSASENAAATEQENPIPVHSGVEPEKPSPAEHVDETKTLLEKIPSQPRIGSIAAPDLTEREAEEKLKLRSEIEHSLSDAEEYLVGADSPRAGRTRRVPSRKRKTRSLSRSRRRARSSPTRNPISQLGEIVSRLPMSDNVQGGVHLHFTLFPVTHIHGGYQAGATPTAAVPQVGNVTFINSNNTCTCEQHAPETDGGSCLLLVRADSSGN